jgi:predicted TIM-barrel fold metal-dependent hydrolase
MSRRHKQRFSPSCSANPWLGKAAFAELKRAIGEGAGIFLLHPFVQGFLANDELIFPLLDFLQTKKLPVYIHTEPPGNATLFQVVDLAERYSSLDFIIGHWGPRIFGMMLLRPENQLRTFTWRLHSHGLFISRITLAEVRRRSAEFCDS